MRCGATITMIMDRKRRDSMGRSVDGFGSFLWVITGRFFVIVESLGEGMATRQDAMGPIEESEKFEAIGREHKTKVS